MWKIFFFIIEILVVRLENFTEIKTQNIGEIGAIGEI